MIAIDLIVSGVLLGGVYALLAVGLNLIFGVMRVVNFAHGELLMLGAMATAWLYLTHGVHPLFGLVGITIVVYLFGGVVQRLLIERLVDGPPVMSLLATFGLSILLVNLGLLLWGGSFMSLPGFLTGALQLGGLVLPYGRLVPFIIALVSTFGVYLFLQKHSLGKAMRAVSQRAEMAEVCGIDAARVRRLTFAIGSGMAAIAGALLVPIFAVDFQMGERFALKAFSIVIIGGLGSYSGAFLGALLVGIVEVTGGYLTSASSAEAGIYALMIAVLLVRPQGLLGNRTTL